MGRLYLDYNATAPLRPEARAAVIAVLGEVGNASSVHGEGRAAHHRIEDARSAVAALVGGEAKAVTFTSGGTEANNTVLTPHWTVGGKAVHFDRLLVGATEHPSVLAGGRFAANTVRQIAVDGEGIVDREDLRRLLVEAKDRGERALVSVMLANNETGAIQPVADVARIGHEAGAFVHTDAVQAAGRMPVDIAAMGADVFTLSAHKIGGPQGAGAIVRANDDVAFSPLMTGGGQEKRGRAGTENVAAIAGFGAAAAAAGADMGAIGRLTRLRDGMAAVMAETGRKVTVFSEGAKRLPQTLCVSVEGISAETLLIALDLEGVAVSSGSACSSGKVAPSHVLSAMGISQNLAKGAIRLSLGWDSKDSDLDLFSTAWRRVLKHMPSGAERAA